MEYDWTHTGEHLAHLTNLQLMKAGKRPTMTGAMFNPFRKKKTQRAVVGIEALRCFAKG